MSSVPAPHANSWCRPIMWDESRLKPMTISLDPSTIEAYRLALVVLAGLCWIPISEPRFPLRKVLGFPAADLSLSRKVLEGLYRHVRCRKGCP